MQENGQQGVPLTKLLGVRGLDKARVISCQNELDHRYARSIILIEGKSASGEPQTKNRIFEHCNLQEDQLVLVDFSSPPEIDELKNLIELAAESSCTAVILHSPASISFPASWIQQVEALGLPFLELPSDVSPAELVTPLVEELLRREHALLNQITSVQERMVSQILAGRGGQGIVDLLFTFVGQPVLLIDNNGTILGKAGIWHQIPIADILSNPEQLNSILKSLADQVEQWYGSEGSLRLLTVGKERLFTRPVIVGKDILGWFILNLEPEALDISARLALDQAAIAAALEIGRQAAIQQVEWRLQSKLLDDLFMHDAPTGVLEERAQGLGWDLRYKRAVMLVGWDEYEITAQQQRQATAAITRFFRAWRPDSLVLQREDEIVILPHLLEASDSKLTMEILKSLAHDLLKDWPPYLKKIPIVISIGSVQPSLRDIANSYHEAQRALAMRHRLGLRDPLITFQDVRIFSLIEHHMDDDEAVALFKRTVGPLAEYDAKHKTELVRTAEVYFDCNYRLQQAADQLLIHPSSLKYRLQRIRDILGSDPFFDKDHLDYYLATKIARLF
jgi:PucR family transcriptional regulator, purine catabolism regulatory protein